ncbi:MAG: hypothetical protein A2Y17_01615 [Clostridiales bacterium GWF2_38_85]|nr:MAG: hypothetical protein A2Y17_01615 [Clostridiales bacterium GWF2_38_85]
MRYALISDVHGNYPALCAVLEDANSANINKYIFIGDYYMCFPYSNQVIEKIRNYPNSYAVRGNEEDRIEMLSKKDKSTWTDGQFQALYWYYNEITSENRKYLKELPRSAVIDEHLHAAHWSSEFIGNVEMEKFSTSRLQQRFGDRTPTKEDIITVILEILDSDATFNKRLSELDDGVYIFGHSHIQWHKQYGNKFFINPGSCGFPIDFSGGAPYTILEIENGVVSVDERRIMYDEDKCVNDLLNSSLYMHEKVWNDIIIKEFKAHSEVLMHFLMFVEDYANKINDKIRPYTKQTWAEAYSAWQQL